MMSNLVFPRLNVTLLATILFLFLATGEGFRSTPTDVPKGSNDRGSLRGEKDVMVAKEATDDVLMEVYASGSSLPDCSHACGPCFPCKRVMVSFKCSVAESCPIVYRCMCRGKYYHVPSN